MIFLINGLIIKYKAIIRYIFETLLLLTILSLIIHKVDVMAKNPLFSVNISSLFM